MSSLLHSQSRKHMSAYFLSRSYSNAHLVPEWIIGLANVNPEVACISNTGLGLNIVRVVVGISAPLVRRAVDLRAVAAGIASGGVLDVGIPEGVAVDEAGIPPQHGVPLVFELKDLAVSIIGPAAEDLDRCTVVVLDPFMGSPRDLSAAGGDHKRLAAGAIWAGVTVGGFLVVLVDVDIVVAPIESLLAMNNAGEIE